MAPLSSREQELLSFIKSYTAEQGRGPSTFDIQAHMGLSAKASVQRLVAALERKQVLRRVRGKARTFEIMDGAGGEILQ